MRDLSAVSRQDSTLKETNARVEHLSSIKSGLLLMLQIMFISVQFPAAEEHKVKYSTRENKQAEMCSENFEF